jgi:hypothetical protein
LPDTVIASPQTGFLLYPGSKPRVQSRLPEGDP